jgi:hypothetical protein
MRPIEKNHGLGVTFFNSAFPLLALADFYSPSGMQGPFCRRPSPISGGRSIARFSFFANTGENPV